jgi:hypothetical protein
MLHAVFYNNNLIGLFSDYDKCNIAIDGLAQNKFINKNKIIIKKFYNNSFTIYEDKNEIEEFSDIETTEEKPKEIIDNKQKLEMQQALNELKKTKQKMEESKHVYNVDIELFNKFKKLQLENNNFIIPEMFIDKYNLMLELENQNKLCWENFYELYEPKKVETSFSKLFE